jgi:transcriptional regulator with XRE-family HTH domain
MRNHNEFGKLLRHWREDRRLSQLALAGNAEISTKHLSFLETGRAAPSREMIVRLAEELQIPLRQRNALLHAAGYADLYPERPLGAPGLQLVGEVVRTVLTGHEPYPAMAIDCCWNIVAMNRASETLIRSVSRGSGARSINQVYKHPVVYVEWGGHEFWPTSSWSIAAASKHNGLGKYSYFGDAPVDVTYLPVFLSNGAQNLPSPLPNADVALVTLFAGFWGAPQSHNGPPQGPPLHCEWFWDPSWEPASLGNPPPPGSPLANLLDNLEAGQSLTPTASKSQGVCGGGRPF